MRTGPEFEARVQRLKRGLEEAGLSGVVVVPGPNMKYFTGVDSLMLERPFMLLVPTDGEVHLVAPTLESGPYQRSSLRMAIHPWTDSEGPRAAIYSAIRESGMKGRWGIEGRVPFSYMEKLLEKARIKPADAEPVLQRLRETKDGTEVRLLKEAGAILSRAFEEFPGLLKDGVSELEVAKAATEVIYSHGATAVDDMLVQGGPKAADPHHLPSERKLSHGDSVVMDVGATYKGYYADVTRTFSIGPSQEVEKTYAKVLEAQEAAIEAAGAGVRVGAVDSAARKVLTRAGMGKNFFHRTGHGLGLEIHEAPYIVEYGKEELGPGMCFTVEPGAYFRGRLGVRIEDDVLIEGKQGAVITYAPKEYGWWK